MLDEMMKGTMAHEDKR